MLERVVDYATLLYKVGGEKPKIEENICVSALQRWTICKDRKETSSTGYIKGKLGGWENIYSDHSFYSFNPMNTQPVQKLKTKFVNS